MLNMLRSSIHRKTVVKDWQLIWNPSSTLFIVPVWQPKKHTANKITPAYTAFALSNNRPTALANYGYLMLCFFSNNADCVLLYQHLAEMIDYNAHCDYCIANGFGKNQVKIVLNSPKAANYQYRLYHCFMQIWPKFHHWWGPGTNYFIF